MWRSVGKIVDGGWWTVGGQWTVDSGWRMTMEDDDGKWRMADGGWRMEDGGWRIADKMDVGKM